MADDQVEVADVSATENAAPKPKRQRSQAAADVGQPEDTSADTDTVTFIKVSKNGETIEINPLTREAHALIGWI
jgi:hypothetical protein